jgi:hypothetical protein
MGFVSSAIKPGSNAPRQTAKTPLSATRRAGDLASLVRLFLEVFEE